MNKPPKVLIFFLHICQFIPVFTFTLFIIAGSYAVSDLGGAANIGVYVVTFYGLGNALILPLTNKLATKYGKEKVLLISLISFLIMTVLCFFASTFVELVAFRFLQGMSGGALFPTSLGLLRKISPDEDILRVIKLEAIILTVSPSLGASYGGWIAYDYSWRIIFYPYVPIVLGTIVCLVNYYDHLKTERKPLVIDWIGYIGFFLSFFLIGFIIALGQELDWYRSPLLNVFLGIAIICFTFFILHIWTHKDPIIDLRLFKNSVFSFTVINIIFLYATYFAMIILIAYWLHFFANYTPLWIAVLLIHMLIAGGILYAIVEKWLNKFPPVFSLFLSIVFLGISSFYSTTFNAETDFYRLAISRTLAGFGLAFFLYPLLVLLRQNVPLEQEKDAVCVFNTCRFLSGAISSSAFTTLWWRRKVFYGERLGEGLTIGSELTNQFFMQIKEHLGLKGLKAKVLLEAALMRQSSALALEDCFYLMGWMMVVLGFFCICFFTITKLKKSSLEKEDQNTTLN